MAGARTRRRLDDELVAQGLFRPRDEAMRAVLAGEVSSRGERLTSPGAQVRPGCELHVRAASRYVSRGGLKLEGALDAFGLDPTDLSCLDVGCSTGGFTDCLLKRGARRVAAVDVGRAQFAWSLRTDERVSLFEDTNICDADPALLGAPFDLAVADVSFTSVARILDSVCALLGPQGALCTLVKPQFEAARDEVDEGGVVRDPAVHARVLRDTLATFDRSTLSVQALGVSPIHGAKGNIEFFLYARQGVSALPVDVDALVAQAWGSASDSGALRAQA
ncbi:MAG: TlyA family RNA methyltransferase [Coriobacteriia bacterium]|nr:TlyA family RNA methyltransferase [Coriobacteriia bacterium]